MAEPVYKIQDKVVLDANPYSGRQGTVVWIEKLGSNNKGYGVRITITAQEWKAKRSKTRKAMLEDGTATVNPDGTVTITHFVAEASLHHA